MDYSERQNTPKRRTLNKAIVFSVFAACALGIPEALSDACPLTFSDTVLVFSLHCLVVLFPIMQAVKLYQETQDLFFPGFVAALTFAIFHVMNNMSVLSAPFLLLARKLPVESTPLRIVVIESYVVVFVAWLSYWFGYHVIQIFKIKRPLRSPPVVRRSLTTPFYLVVSVVFIGLGILGNMIPLGGLSQYLHKMSYFFTREQEYVEFMQWGGTKYTIAQKFLPVGLTLLVYGYSLQKRLTALPQLSLFALAAVANLFLSCSSGGRGTLLMVAFYAIILINYSITRLKFRHLVIVLLPLMIFTFVLGIARSVFYYGGIGTDVLTLLRENLTTELKRFSGLYFTNYLGTLSLVQEVQTYGVAWGTTAFAGITGLLGGPTPVSTQSEIWYRLTGRYEGVNPRYGPPGELYFNFGFVGVIIGMFCIGILVKWMSDFYQACIERPQTVANGILIIFIVHTAHFVMIANLNYLPPYFTYFSAPFYLVFFLFRRIKC